MDGEDVRFRQVKYALVLIIVFIVFVFVSLDATGQKKKENGEETNKEVTIDPSTLSENEKIDAGIVVGNIDYLLESGEVDILLTSGDEDEFIESGEVSDSFESGDEITLLDEVVEEETIISGENLSGEAN